MTTATTTDWNLEDLTADRFEAMYDAAPAPAKPGVGRDALGRFCRRTWQGEVGVFFTAAETSHSHLRCGTLAKAMKSGAEVVAESNASGWLCSGCVAVETSAWIASLDVAPSTGEQECDTCHTVKGLKKFPTVVHFNAVRDRGDTCRACESTRRTLGRFTDDR